MYRLRLTYAKPHLSITEFPETEIPDFTLITGVNGAGKTHLLQSISRGFIEVTPHLNIKTDVRIFDWNSLHPGGAAAAKAISLYDAQTKILQQGQSAIQGQREPLLDIARRFRLDRHATEPKEIIDLRKADLAGILGSDEEAQRLKASGEPGAIQYLGFPKNCQFQTADLAHTTAASRSKFPTTTY